MTAPASQHIVRMRRDGTAFRAERRADDVAREEPLEVRIEHRGVNVPFMVTMRTPGDDEALAAGFLFTEGLVDGPGDLLEVRPCRDLDPDGAPVENVIQAWLAPARDVDLEGLRRNVFMSSSCGVCGKASIDAVAVATRPLPAAEPFIDAAALAAVPARLRAAQTGFRMTGGSHATALVDRAGEVQDVAEDVGRHNAMDKVIGRLFLADGLPLGTRFLAVSGRLSFELVQKAARAGCPLLAGIGAPSDLAVATAERVGMTLVGFLAEDRFNVYSVPERIRL